jgi:uncharacterized protein YerC
MSLFLCLETNFIKKLVSIFLFFKNKKKIFQNFVDIYVLKEYNHSQNKYFITRVLKK